MHTSSSRRRGFTLLWLVIFLGIIAIVMAAYWSARSAPPNYPTPDAPAWEEKMDTESRWEREKPQAPETVPVSGKITYGGGRWPKPGVLYFIPIEAADGYPARSVAAPFDREGRFTADSFRGTKGLIPGRYKIVVECWETPPNMDGIPSKSYVPEGFLNARTSSLELVVEPDTKSVSASFDVPKP